MKTINSTMLFFFIGLISYDQPIFTEFVMGGIYDTDVIRGLDKIDPIVISDVYISPINIVESADAAENFDTNGSYAGTNSTGSLDWAADWLENDASGGGASGGNVKVSSNTLVILDNAVGDNCLEVANADQADMDGDSVGDACDACPDSDNNVDEDNDGIPDCIECGNNKILVCHVPPGNPCNEQQLCISENAADAHLSGGNGHGTCYLATWVPLYRNWLIMSMMTSLLLLLIMSPLHLSFSLIRQMERSIFNWNRLKAKQLKYWFIIT